MLLPRSDSLMVCDGIFLYKLYRNRPGRTALPRDSSLCFEIRWAWTGYIPPFPRWWSLEELSWIRTTKINQFPLVRNIFPTYPCNRSPFDQGIHCYRCLWVRREKAIFLKGSKHFLRNMNSGAFLNGSLMFYSDTKRSLFHRHWATSTWNSHRDVWSRAKSRSSQSNNSNWNGKSFDNEASGQRAEKL